MSSCADNLGYDTLVTVASGHLVSYADLTLLGDIDLGHLNTRRREDHHRS
jgi:hypothetical protein